MCKISFTLEIHQKQGSGDQTQTGGTVRSPQNHEHDIEDSARKKSRLICLLLCLLYLVATILKTQMIVLIMRVENSIISKLKGHPKQ